MTLLEYLKSTKTAFTNSLSSYSDVHFVIGNESCDLDSTVSSLILAYYLSVHKSPRIPNSALVIPVLNVSRENFLLRTDNCFVLRELGVPLEYLIYRDVVDFEELVITKRVTASLVDHHILSKNDSVLESSVIEILDHRPFDTNSKWNKNVKLKIQEVGSCSTLVADLIFETDEDFLNRDLAYAIYETIIFDTVALIAEVGRAKELDFAVTKKLENKFEFNQDRKVVYDKLWAAHNDVSHLSPRQILVKDLKIVENLPVPGLPMLTEDFLQLKDAYDAVENTAQEYKVPVLVLVGLDATKEVKRDIGVFWTTEGETLKDILLDKFNNSEKLKGYNFCFEEVNSGYNNIICLRQNNIKLSRKQVIPLIKDAVLELGKTG
ncbi:hypothetical protein NQ315_000937 [Exocentrus adspersus]|uniref:DHHA2 domain-containing protein n=1 Tax=Exocentrus adspersus TaxID=1586481 RepID=A0AAV8WDY8_9CUCU|nr:hypothetical protein NQ315_000937 [Exocentrus adspersus]